MRLNDRVERVTLIAYLLSLSGLIVLAALAYGVADREQEAAQWVRHTEGVIDLNNQVQQIMQRLESAERAYLLTGYSHFKVGMAEETAEVNARLGDLKRQTVDNALQQKHLAAMQDLVTQKLELIEARIYLRDNVSVEKAHESALRNEGREDMELINGLGMLVQHEERRLLQIRTADQTRVSGYMASLRNFIVLGSALFLTALFWYMNRLLRLRRKAEAEAVHLAYHDMLTGLPNRRLLLDRLQQSTLAAQRQSGQFALLFLDLDGFKQVNDTLGHDSGDELLQQVAQRLQELLRQSDTVARIGGDEFVIGLTTTENLRDAAEVADKVVESLGRPFVLSKGTVSIGTSIGISLYPEHGIDAETLISSADKALYQAKREGKNRHVIYAHDMNPITGGPA